jgi:hypothetical protein
VVSVMDLMTDEFGGAAGAIDDELQLEAHARL